ncbi:hypothetical protein ACF09K_31515 [Streptomyces sp. NPDC014882]|uniref:hypothetical protein n=1 Tax=Streptomyces sp. NPDC014882 TaxID=3364927 RepID=UPI0036FA04EF
MSSTTSSIVSTPAPAPHPAVQKSGHRDFVDGTVAQPVLGELDLGRDSGRVQEVPDLLAEVERR